MHTVSSSLGRGERCGIELIQKLRLLPLAARLGPSIATRASAPPSLPPSLPPAASCRNLQDNPRVHTPSTFHSPRTPRGCLALQLLEVPMHAQGPRSTAAALRSARLSISPKSMLSSLIRHQHTFFPLPTYRYCSSCVPLVTILHIHAIHAPPSYSSLLSHPPPFLPPFLFPLHRTYRRLGTSGRPCRTS